MSTRAPALLLTSLGLALAAASTPGCERTPQPPVRRGTGPGRGASGDATAPAVPSPARPPRPGVRAHPAPPEPTGVLAAADLHRQIVRVPAKEHRWRWGEGRRLRVRGAFLKLDTGTREAWLDTGVPGTPIVASFPRWRDLASRRGPLEGAHGVVNCRFSRVVTGQVWLRDCAIEKIETAARSAPARTRPR